tara:strand:- start:188 stop:514 length:327 start_codon:yes stop_codon:yes gene_type:complete
LNQENLTKKEIQTKAADQVAAEGAVLQEEAGAALQKEAGVVLQKEVVVALQKKVEVLLQKEVVVALRKKARAKEIITELTETKINFFFSFVKVVSIFKKSHFPTSVFL